jgi:hypothetical protein
MLPALRHAIERSDRAALDQQLVRYDAVLDRLEARTAQLEKILR